jgi:hypothetical protein
LTWRGGSAPARIPLAGTGVKIPVPGLSVSPDPVDFGLRPVTQNSAPLAVTVTNTGDGPLHISAVTVAGSGPTEFPADYRITADTCTGVPVAPAGACQVTVAHRPLGVGVRPAALSFTDDV